MIYHVNITLFKEYSFKTSVQFILFLSRLLNSAKTRYWFIELKLIELIWVLRKVRHFVKSSKLSSIIYTDHEAFLKIVKQISLSISSIDKLNLRLVRAFEYIQRFSLIIRHKSEEFHVVSNVLFRLFITNNSLSNSVNNENEFDVLFTAFDCLIDSFIRRCGTGYAGPMRVYLLVFTYRKTLQRKKNPYLLSLIDWFSKLFRSSFDIDSMSFFTCSLISWYVLLLIVDWMKMFMSHCELN